MTHIDYVFIALGILCCVAGILLDWYLLITVGASWISTPVLLASLSKDYT